MDARDEQSLMAEMDDGPSPRHHLVRRTGGFYTRFDQTLANWHLAFVAFMGAFAFAAFAAGGFTFIYHPTCPARGTR
ncbi:hypothetical protein OC835_002496 [Tilletia horrida]|nr:hypothetical protein OC835_002496 [Tilletia horrida]KAK0561711.1 hypothetical protein OC844_003062 [Tilletia horrida]